MSIYCVYVCMCVCVYVCIGKTTDLNTKAKGYERNKDRVYFNKGIWPVTNHHRGNGYVLASVKVNDHVV